MSNKLFAENPAENELQTPMKTFRINRRMTLKNLSLDGGATNPDQPPEVLYLDDVRSRFVVSQTPVE